MKQFPAMNTTTIVETERLILRTWKPEDFPAFAAMNANAEVMRYFLAPLSMEESLTTLARILAEHRESGYGLYALERKEDHRLIGLLGLHRVTFDAPFAPCVEIGWRLIPEAWGHGYATEAASACLKYALCELNLPEVYSFTALPNMRSSRVMERAGMEKVGEFDHPNVPASHPLLRHVLYRADKTLLGW